MAGNVITLCTGSATVFPTASEAEIISSLATHMVGTEVGVEGFGLCIGLVTTVPLARKGFGSIIGLGIYGIC